MIAHIYAFIMCLSSFWLLASIYMIITHLMNFWKHEDNKKVDSWHHRTMAFRWMIVASVCASWLVGRAAI